ncbi:uncharacterized protein LOC119685927 [Teleopsis dalmanni]|uniref:uncharacterized protein LOC119685920 n=1 Tax=Teleopsis dalmanni TaxID=139649 RepID=UPI0018CF4E63|nr:uncharacterized protein LOC119685920 [Teleopsis dalmanni]XP_037956262.1 uncharacterized protein LOC119685927 [Teleopsis dalmanni]
MSSSETSSIDTNETVDGDLEFGNDCDLSNQQNISLKSSEKSRSLKEQVLFSVAENSAGRYFNGSHDLVKNSNQDLSSHEAIIMTSNQANSSTAMGGGDAPIYPFCDNQQSERLPSVYSSDTDLTEHGDASLNSNIEHDASGDFSSEILPQLYLKKNENDCLNSKKRVFIPLSSETESLGLNSINDLKTEHDIFCLNNDADAKKQNKKEEINSTKADAETDSDVAYSNFFRDLGNCSTYSLMNSFDMGKITKHFEALSSNSINELKESVELHELLENCNVEDRISLVCDYFKKKLSPLNEKDQEENRIKTDMSDKDKSAANACLGDHERSEIMQKTNSKEKEDATKSDELPSGSNSTEALKLDNTEQSLGENNIKTMIDNEVFHEYTTKIFDLTGKSVTNFPHNIRQMCLILNSEADFMEDVIANPAADEDIKNFFYEKSLDHVQNIMASFSRKWASQ